jgi:hypothetical protein
MSLIDRVAAGLDTYLAYRTSKGEILPEGESDVLIRRIAADAVRLACQTKWAVRGTR